ncbi:hypothetical protein AH04_272 [Erwinia phage AH04]|uniref:Uncharacterized protein n=1 Tax=Erwinia phage AH04 TaxID=2869569 RepID=A0AAE7X0U5_9CAUD|nr:hypothetical protein PQC02_gp042 [Erwinia phage AH04]QZA70745.1 hypothetical protein AH04_272 [Erwinia phage AH04]
MTDKISKVVELIKVAKPKNVCVLLEVPVGHTFDDAKVNSRNVQRLDEILGEVEDGAVDPSIPMTCHLVTKTPVKEGHAQILPMYSFFDPKVKLRSVMVYDLVLVKCLDNKYLVMKVPEGIDLLPFAQLD